MNNGKTCHDCCKRDVCAIIRVVDASREATVQAFYQKPCTEEQLNRMDELWGPLDGLAMVCPYFGGKG